MKNVLKIALFAALLILCVLLIRTETFARVLEGDVSAVLESTNGIGVLLGLSLVLMIIQNLFTIIPLFLLISANVVMYGFAYGYVISWLTSIIGAIVSFLIVRFWFQDMFVKVLNQKLKDKIEKNGFIFVFIGRIFPFMPTSAINIASGISSISMKHFVISTIFGNMIYMFVLALIPLGVMSIDAENTVYVTIAVVCAAIFIGYKLWKRKKRVVPEE